MPDLGGLPVDGLQAHTRNSAEPGRDIPTLPGWTGHHVESSTFSVVDDRQVANLPVGSFEISAKSSSTTLANTKSNAAERLRWNAKAVRAENKMVIAKPELPPIEVTIKDQVGNPITGAHVRATYTHSGLSSGGTSDQDGMATVPLLYCDNEPMRVEAVATGYQADNVGEFQPNREQFSLEMKLEELKSEWEQVTIPLNPSSDDGQADLPIGGRIQINRTRFRIQISGDVSVNGTVQMWYPFNVGDEYSIVTRDGTELTVRFLEQQPRFSVTLEISPPRQHRCGG